MSRATQSKAQTEANAKILRALVKHPDNKVCVDCKKNDPRWASWNIGCFLCIRCSGLHRSMGTHISKVKSIDLDIWTPEQMESMQKWGNRRCNLYWEAHLKSGHVPADHKIESFIRSKYESRRWAKDGPPPSDPAVLDGGAAPSVVPAPAPVAATSTPTSSRSPVPAAPAKPFDLFDDDEAPAAPAAPAKVPPKVTAAAAAPAAAAKASTGGGGGIFDLDWHEPAASSSSATSPTSASGARGKNDIMSLFASKPAAASGPVSPSAGGFGDFGSFSAASPAFAPSQSSNGLSGLNSSFGGLDLSSSSTPSMKTAAPVSSNPWSSAAPSANTASSGGNSLFDGHDVWGSSGSTTTTQQSKPQPPPKNDAFADIWGDFK